MAGERDFITGCAALRMTGRGFGLNGEKLLEREGGLGYVQSERDVLSL